MGTGGQHFGVPLRGRAFVLRTAPCFTVAALRASIPNAGAVA
jgi:hypothetical protein